MKFTAGAQAKPSRKGNQQQHQRDQSPVKWVRDCDWVYDRDRGCVKGEGCQMLAHFMGGRATWRIRKRKRT